MPFIKLHFKKSLRNVFTEGEDILIDFFTDKDTITLVGKNGAGKSTLVNCIRNFKCDNYKCGSSESLNRYDIKDLSNYVDIDTDFEKIFVFSSEYDDPLSMNNTYDATSFVELGGIGSNFVSKGQRFHGAFVRFIQNNKANFKDSLVILDEPDNGFDLDTQTKNAMLFLMLPLKSQCKLLLITHSLITILNSFDVYDLKKRSFVSSKDFIREITGYNITIEREKTEDAADD